MGVCLLTFMAQFSLNCPIYPPRFDGLKPFAQSCSIERYLRTTNKWLIAYFSANDVSSQSKKSREYCPRPGSAGYAIIIALYEESQKPNSKGHMTKEEICKKAQPFTETSLKHGKAGASGPESWYTGWSCLTTLVRLFKYVPSYLVSYKLGQGSYHCFCYHCR